MWKLLLAIALLGASARGNFVEELVGRVLKTANPAKAYNPLFDTDHVAELVEHLVKPDILEVERDWDSDSEDVAAANPPKTSKSSTSTTTATKTSKSSTSTTTTVAPSPTSSPPPPCYNDGKFGDCFNAWTLSFGCNTTKRMNISMNSVVTALKKYSSAKFGNLAKVCNATKTFKQCVGTQAQYDTCVLASNLRKFFKTQNDADAAHDLAYMIPAECSKEAQKPFATIATHYTCFTKVTYTQEDKCASKKYNDSLPLCDNLVNNEFHCIPDLYKAQCGNKVAQAMCQLLKIQLSAIPDFKQFNVSKCNAHCEKYNAAPSTSGLPLILLLAAALFAFLHF